MYYLDSSAFITSQFAMGAMIMAILGVAALHSKVKGLWPISALIAIAIAVDWMHGNGML